MSAPAQRKSEDPAATGAGSGPERADRPDRPDGPERVPGPAEVLSRVEETLARCGRAALAQIVRAEGSTAGKTGWKMLVSPAGDAFGNLGGGAFEAMVIADARKLLESSAAAGREPAAGTLERYYLTEEAVKGRPTGMACGGMAEVFLEVIEAPPVAMIFGGGPVGQALARAAALAGFEPVVADDREEFRRSELFPADTRVPPVGRDFRGEYLGKLAGRPLYAAVVSRCWETDVAAMEALLGSAPANLAYLGLMGSRRKIERVRSELAERGVALDGVPLHAPIGLPIGGDSPGEIAIGILAEMIQARYALQGSTR